MLCVWWPKGGGGDYCDSKDDFEADLAMPGRSDSGTVLGALTSPLLCLLAPPAPLPLLLPRLDWPPEADTDCATSSGIPTGSTGGGLFLCIDQPGSQQ